MALVLVPAAVTGIWWASDFAVPWVTLVVGSALLAGLVEFHGGARRSLPIWMLAAAAIAFVLVLGAVWLSFDGLDLCPNTEGYCDPG